MYLDPRGAGDPPGVPVGTMYGYCNVLIGGLEGVFISKLRIHDSMNKYGVSLSSIERSGILGPYIGDADTLFYFVAEMEGTVLNRLGEFVDVSETVNSPVCSYLPPRVQVTWPTLEVISQERKNRTSTVVFNNPVPYAPDADFSFSVTDESGDPVSFTWSRRTNPIYTSFGSSSTCVLPGSPEEFVLKITGLVPVTSGALSITGTYNGSVTTSPIIVPDLTVPNAEVTVTTNDGFAPVDVNIVFVAKDGSSIIEGVSNDAIEVPPNDFFIYAKGTFNLDAHLVVGNVFNANDVIRSSRLTGEKRKRVRFLP